MALQRGQLRVEGIDVRDRRVCASQTHELVFDDLSWTADAAPAPGAYAAKTRYRQQDAACTLAAGPTPQSRVLRFAEPQWAVTPGQSAVLYDGEVCLGGGVIAQAETLEPNQALAQL